MPIIGNQQSPIRIDLEKSIKATFPADYFEIRYPDEDLPGSFKDDNFVFERGYRPEIAYQNRPWVLHKIHIHRPSEHRIGPGGPFAYECHLVHFAKEDGDEAGPKVVIGVFFQVNE